MTPSKSKTIARSAIRAGMRTAVSPVAAHAYLLAGSHRDLEAVLLRRVRTFVGQVVVAVRIVGAVEVHLVEVRAVRRQIEIAAGRIGFGAAGQIAEGDEQVIGIGDLDEDGELQLRALEGELERADAT